MAVRQYPSLFHPIDGELPLLEGGYSTSTSKPREELFIRIIDAFKPSIQRMENREDTVWHVIAQRYHGDLLALLTSNDSGGLAEYFRRIHEIGILKGIDQDQDMTRKITGSEDERARLLLNFKDLLVQLAEALGCLPIEIPGYRDRCENLNADTDVLIDLIEQKLGIDISPPSVTAGRFGLKTGRQAIITNRDLYAIYCAYRIRELTKHLDRPRVCEIGGGMGRVAYYAWKMGIENYVLFDLPQITAMQGYWLDTALPDTVTLFGESNERRHSEGIAILPSWHFADYAGGFDLVLNTDSMPEMGPSIAREYVDQIKSKRVPLFLSINQEARKEMVPGGPTHAVVSAVVDEAGGFEKTYRFPFWLRKGYAEELYRRV